MQKRGEGRGNSHLRAKLPAAPKAGHSDPATSLREKHTELNRPKKSSQCSALLPWRSMQLVLHEVCALALTHFKSMLPPWCLEQDGIGSRLAGSFYQQLRSRHKARVAKLN